MLVPCSVVLDRIVCDVFTEFGLGVAWGVERADDVCSVVVDHFGSGVASATVFNLVEYVSKRNVFRDDVECKHAQWFTVRASEQRVTT